MCKGVGYSECIRDEKLDKTIMNFTSKQMESKWNNKKKSCLKRGIDLHLSKQEFITLYQTHDMVCDYTGTQMSTHHEDCNYITLERCNEKLPYQKGNICFVRKDVNSWKGLVVDHLGEDNFGARIKPDNKILFVEMMKTIFNEDKMLEIKEKYVKVLEASGTPSDEISTEHEQSIEQNENSSVQGSQEEFEHNNESIKGKQSMTTIYIPVNTEISTARKYAAFGEFIESVCGSEFNLTYAEFSKKVRRKTCSLTNKPIVTQGYFISDKTVPVSNDTFFVVEKSVGEKIDNLMEECKIDFKTMKTLCKNFNKM